MITDTNNNAGAARAKQKYNIIPAYLGANGQPTDAACAICGKTFEQLGDYAPALTNGAWVCYPCVNEHDTKYYVRAYLEQKSARVQGVLRQVERAQANLRKELASLYSDANIGLGAWVIYLGDRTLGTATPAKSSDCVLCSDGDIHEGGGVFWTDNRWICPTCYGQAAEYFKAGASA